MRLERLSRRAAHDALRAHGAHLPDDQFDALAVHLLGIGVQAYASYDPDLASGVSRETYTYRAMRGYRRGGSLTDGPYIDWLRRHVRDSRFEPERVVALSDDGTLPEPVVEDVEPELETIVEQYAGGLSERDAWTLRHVAAAIAHGLTLVEVVEGLLRDLADAIGPQIGRSRGLQPDLGTIEHLFADWLHEARS